MKGFGTQVFLLLAALAATRQVRLPLARDAIRVANREVEQAILRAKSGGSAQRVVVPRSLAGELPPQALNSIISNAASLSDGKGPLTILPPRVVSPSEIGQYEKDPQLALRKQAHKKFARHQGGRGLQLPYFNSGPGYMDVGSNGFSPLSFAMMRPDAASMSPFVPRNTPPPPIRIQLQDPLQDNYKRNILSESEFRVNNEETEHLEKTLQSAILALSENFKAVRMSVEDSLENIKNKALTVEQHRQSNKESARNMELQMDKMREEMAQENRNKVVAKLIGEIANSVNKEDQKEALKPTQTQNKEVKTGGEQTKETDKNANKVVLEDTGVGLENKKTERSLSDNQISLEASVPDTATQASADWALARDAAKADAPKPLEKSMPAHLTAPGLFSRD